MSTSCWSYCLLISGNVPELVFVECGSRLIFIHAAQGTGATGGRVLQKKGQSLRGYVRMPADIARVERLIL